MDRQRGSCYVENVGMRQPYRPLVIAGGAALAVLVVVTVMLGGAGVHRDAALRASLELALGLVVLLAALVAFRRFGERGRVGELVLGGALSALALASLLAGALPVLISEETEASLAWVRFPPLLLAGAALAASPFLLDRTVAPRRAHVAGALALVGALQLASGLAVHALAERLPAALGEPLAGGAYGWPADTQPVLVAGDWLVVCLLAVAAVGFMREAAGAGDRSVRWLGLGCALAAVAHLQYALHPTLYSDAVTIGDGFRVAFAACVLAWTVREVSEYQREVMAAAVAQERRRLARELHDGLAQELAFLVAQTHLLAFRHGDIDGLDALERTSQRALDESRIAIGVLTRPGEEPLDVALESVVEDLADRMGTNVRLRLAPGVDVEPALRDALLRIVREAMTNAVRHGGATSVSVELDNGNGLRLRVEDDGRGFSVDAAPRRGSGLGLVSMRERAEALGGRLTVASRPGEGTSVELVLP